MRHHIPRVFQEALVELGLFDVIVISVVLLHSECSLGYTIDTRPNIPPPRGPGAIGT